MSLVLLPILAQAFNISMGAASEVRYRSDQLGGYFDTSVTGQVALGLKLRRSTWTLMYAPSFTELGIGSELGARYVTHTGGLAAQLILSPRTTLTWKESATYGQQNFRLLAVSTPAPAIGGAQSAAAPNGANSAGPTQANASPVVVPANQTFRFGALSNNVGLEYALAKTWSTGAFAGYTFLGELDANNPPLLPRRQNYEAGAQLTNQFARRDSVTVSTRSSLTLTDPDARTTFVTNALTWRHTLSRSATSSVFGATHYVNSYDIVGDHARVVLFGGGASVTVRAPLKPRPGIMTVTLSSTVAPLVDYRYAGVANGASAGGAVGWTRNRLSIQVTGVVWHTIQNFGATSTATTVGATETVVYALDRHRHWSATAGSRQAALYFNEGQRSPLVWVTFLGLSYTTGPIDL